MEIQATNLPGIAGQSFLAGAAQPRPQTASATEIGSSKVEQPAARAQSANKAELQDAVATSNNFLKTVTNAVEFSIDEDSGNTVVKVVDTSTKEVIRQFPTEEMLAIAKALDKIQGLLIKQKA